MSSESATQHNRAPSKEFRTTENAINLLSFSVAQSNKYLLQQALDRRRIRHVLVARAHRCQRFGVCGGGSGRRRAVGVRVAVLFARSVGVRVAVRGVACAVRMRVAVCVGLVLRRFRVTHAIITCQINTKREEKR